jgi:hypothetical protein
VLDPILDDFIAPTGRPLQAPPVEDRDLPIVIVDQFLYIFSGGRAVITIGKTGVTLSIFLKTIHSTSLDARIKYPFSSKVLWRWP